MANRHKPSHYRQGLVRLHAGSSQTPAVRLRPAMATLGCRQNQAYRGFRRASISKLVNGRPLGQWVSPLPYRSIRAEFGLSCQSSTASIRQAKRHELRSLNSWAYVRLLDPVERRHHGETWSMLVGSGVGNRATSQATGSALATLWRGGQGTCSVCLELALPEDRPPAGARQ